MNSPKFFMTTSLHRSKIRFKKFFFKRGQKLNRCLQMMVYNLDTKPFWKTEVDEIDTVEDISKKLPWFLECNPERFPYWWVLKSKKYHIFSATNETDFCRFGKPDPRNVQLLAAMHSGSKKDPKPLVSTYDFIWR